MGSSSFPHQPVIRQHPMVLRPRLLKIILLTTFATTSIIPICRVLSPLTYKPIFFMMLTGIRLGMVLCTRKFKPCVLTTHGP